MTQSTEQWAVIVDKCAALTEYAEHVEAIAALYQVIKNHIQRNVELKYIVANNNNSTAVEADCVNGEVTRYNVGNQLQPTEDD